MPILVTWSPPSVGRGATFEIWYGKRGRRILRADRMMDERRTRHLELGGAFRHHAPDARELTP
jgi:hypothetical protein